MSLNKSSKYIKNCSLFLLFISLRDEIKESKTARKRGKLKGDLSHFCLMDEGFCIQDKEVNNKLKGTQFIGIRIVHLHRAFTDPMAPKALNICPTFTHSLTHSYTDGGISHAMRHPGRRDGSSWGLVSCSFLNKL